MTEQDPDRVEVLPVLPSLNLDETLVFYRDQLGFDRIIHQSPDYLILRRNEMELHFWLARDRALCEATSVYCAAVGLARSMWSISRSGWRV